jgi:nitric oxide reductase NorQ protein
MLHDSNIYALLEGPPGTGKTSLVEAAFPDLELIAGDGDTTSADLVGSYVIAEDGSYEWKDGPAVIAAQEGRVLFIDDATLIPPKVLAVIYPLMDGRREIVLKEHGGRKVQAVDGFYVIAGHNPHVHGAVLSDALASRFTAPIQVSTDYELAEHLGVHKKAVQIARNLATQQRNGATGWAPQMRELLAFKAIEKALGEDAAFGNMIGQAPPDDRELVAAFVAKILGRPVTPLTLGKQFK